MWLRRLRPLLAVLPILEGRLNCHSRHRPPAGTIRTRTASAQRKRTLSAAPRAWRASAAADRGPQRPAVCAPAAAGRLAPAALRALACSDAASRPPHARQRAHHTPRLHGRDLRCVRSACQAAARRRLSGRSRAARRSPAAAMRARPRPRMRRRQRHSAAWQSSPLRRSPAATASVAVAAAILERRVRARCRRCRLWRPGAATRRSWRGERSPPAL